MSINKKKNNSNFIVLHWDSKLLPDIVGHKNVDRLFVIASGLNFEQLLGVPAVNSSQEIEVSSTVYDTLENSSLVDTL